MEQNEPEIRKHPRERFTHAIREMWIVIAVDGHYWASDLFCESQQPAIFAHFLRFSQYLMKLVS